ncbi:MAG: response regulator [bacterium]|nr:response regulator [bacterium]
MTVQRIRVLLVETDEDDRKAVESYVRQEALPYDLYTASSAPEAIKRLQTGEFDVILLDYSLQSTAGPDLLSQAVTTPVIFVTGGGSGQITVKHMPQGAYDYLNKDPYGNYLTILPITIRNAIERQESQHALQQAHERSEQRVAERTKEIKRRLQFEELTSGILAEFIQLPVNEVEKGIDKTLKRIAQHSGTARSSLFIYSKDMSRITNTHEWCADPKESQKERLQDIPAGTFEYYFSVLKKLENVIISSMDDLPPEAVTEREWSSDFIALLRFVADQIHQVIITDQTMPHMTGVHLAGQVKNIRPDIPVILCTGFSESISKENFKSRGIDVFLMKPILKKQISRVIRQLLDGN